MKDTPILLKIKDWIELQMHSTPFLDGCIGLSVLFFVICYSLSMLADKLPWERLLP